VLIAALAALVDAGPGTPSLDRTLGIGLRGPLVALGAAGAGAAGSFITVHPETEQQSSTTP
jgi:hypothetical protein